MKKIVKPVLYILSMIVPAASFAQEQTIEKAAIKNDSLFWAAYNTCNLEMQDRLIADDIEFYHDKGGITLGKAAMLASIQKNLCGAAFRVRREVIDSTASVHFLKANGEVYGALFTGEHNFYLTPTGKPEQLDGHATYADLWLLKNGDWKLARVFSYDHGPAKYTSKHKQVAVSAGVLKKHQGSYHGPQSGDMRVDVAGDHLKLSIGQKVFSIYPESDSSYFMKERDLLFQFAGMKLLVKEGGVVVEEAVRK